MTSEDFNQRPNCKELLESKNNWVLEENEFLSNLLGSKLIKETNNRDKVLIFHIIHKRIVKILVNSVSL
jgi:hypothetical protein